MKMIINEDMKSGVYGSPTPNKQTLKIEQRAFDFNVFYFEKFCMSFLKKLKNSIDIF